MEQTRTRLEERAERLVASGGALVAAQALFRLNHLVKDVWYRDDREAIYALKNRLIRHFYARGFCTEVGIHTQTYHCWDCGGTGEVDETDFIGGDFETRVVACYKCGGTGIYRQHTLYHFRFEIDGRPFSWHQPAGLVDWPVDTVAHERRYEVREPASSADRWRFRLLYLAIIRAYLEVHAA